MPAPPFAPAWTLDGPTSRDLDDALWIERAADGWRVTAFVADVGAAVPDGDPIDVAARAQGETLYHATGNTPMLPRALAENALSLRPLRPRRALAVTVDLDAQLAPVATDLALRVVCSRARLAYHHVPKILESPAHPQHAQIVQAVELARGLLARRRAAGALALYDLRAGWATTEEGTLRPIAPREATVGYVVVQECMILVNAAVARWCVARNLPVLFRNHVARAAAPPRAELLHELDALGAASPAHRDALCERTHLLLGRASYGATLRGHWGLALPAYLHVTSPIRRYADLVNHRQLRAALGGSSPPYDAVALDALAAALHATLDARRDARRADFRAVAERRAARAVARDTLAQADAATFERAVKVEVAAGCDPSPPFARAFQERARRGPVPLVCLTVVFVRAPWTPAWQPLRAAVVAALAARPADAVSLLAQAPSLRAGWPAPDSRVAPTERGGAAWFEATAALPFEDARGRVRSPPQVARTKREATQRAALALLATLADVAVPAFDPPDLPPVEAPSAGAPGPHPVSRLEEWCQRAGTRPAYAFDPPDGPSHAPTRTCHCTVLDVTCAGRGASKADAKRAAAASTLAALAARTENRDP